jgi:putative hydrolase of HD superfamily
VNDERRLGRQLEFVARLDELKSVERMTSVIGESRRENSAEHSWHVALMAALLGEYAPNGIDLPRVVTMLLLHDVVEIEAGDTFCFDETGNHDREDRERRAADRLFGLLPEDQGALLRATWEEFEEGRTAEARFAVALDRFQGLLQNYHNAGGTWRLHKVARERVLKRMEPIREGAPSLWPTVLAVLDEVEEEGGPLG